MSNFVLQGVPDFVLLAAPEHEEGSSRLGQPQYLNPALTQAHRMSVAARPQQGHSSPLTFEGASLRGMRQILLRYGFDLPPGTVGELYGLLEYCDRLDALAGTTMFTANQLPQWRALSSGLDHGRRSPRGRAIELYSRGDIESLRSLHREFETMARLGRDYVAAADSLAALAAVVAQA